MAEQQQENCARMTTRLFKKRATAEAAVAAEKEPQQPLQKKNRVVLGELQNLSNLVFPVDQAAAGAATGKQKQQQQQRPKAKAKAKARAKKALVIKKEDAPKPKEDTESQSDDPQMCGPYASDIYEYLCKMEAEPKRRPLGDYIAKVQKDISPNMRGILVDWLVEVADEYKLVSDTLYMAISYIDRFLSSNVLNRQKLQLLGVSALLIASKYEEINPPNVEDFCYITDNTYTKDEVVKTEADILKALKFEMGSPTVKTFLRRFTKIAQEDHKNLDLQFEFLGCYLAELSLLEYSCVKFVPSMVAASVMFVARFIIRPKVNPWSSALQQYSCYKPEDLKECVLIIHDLYLSRRGATLQAIREKYKQHKFKCVAALPSPPEIPDGVFDSVTD